MTDFRERCIGKASLIGTFAAIPHPVAVEVTAQSGLDFICIDWEHAQIARDTIENMVRAADVHRVPAMVRVPGHAPEAIAAALDSGARGVLVPRVSTAAQAAARGEGVALSAAGRARRRARTRRRLRLPHPRISRRRQCGRSWSRSRSRPPKGSPMSTEIAATDGVDVVFVGPGDLSVSIDAIGPAGADRLGQAIETIIGAALAHGKVAGIFCAKPEDVGRLGREGRQLLHPGQRHDVPRRRRRGRPRCCPQRVSASGRGLIRAAQFGCPQERQFFKLKTFALKSAALRIAFRGWGAFRVRQGLIRQSHCKLRSRVRLKGSSPCRSCHPSRRPWPRRATHSTAFARKFATCTPRHIANLAVRARELGDVIALWYGEGDMVTPAFIRDAAKAALDEGLTFYIPNMRGHGAADRGAVGLPDAACTASTFRSRARPSRRAACRRSTSRSSCWSIPAPTSSTSRRNGRTSTTPST